MTMDVDDSTLPDRIRAVAAQYRGQRGSLLPIIHALQAELGYIPDEACGLLAKELNISRADVYGVVTFYPDFRREPAGRTTMRICRAEACQAVGAERLVEVVRELRGLSPGETAADRSLTVEQVFCLGNCALGPSVEVDGRLLGKVGEDELREVLDDVDARHERGRTSDHDRTERAPARHRLRAG